MVLDFPLIGNWTAWKIGNGKSVRLGEDPWVGAGKNYKLTFSVINKLREKRCFNLVDGQAAHHILLQRTIWKSSREMRMEGDDVKIWNNFVHMLEINFVNLDEEEHDRLIWTRNSTNGDYTTHKGYEMTIIAL